MSSSTSNSDALKNSRRIFLRIFITIVLCMGISLGLARAFVGANGASSRSLLGRVIEAQEAIPQIAAEENDLVMFFGSSMVQAGFSPREFDRSLAEMGASTTSFNFGFGGLNPLFQDYASRRIVESFNVENRRLKLVLIEFNPFQTTRSRRELQRAQEDSYIALMASPRELLSREPGVSESDVELYRIGIE